MLRDDTASDVFASFVEENEPRLRRALTAAYGSEVGREAAAEALAYGWQHWERIGSMDNPAGYLYRVGSDRARHMRRRLPSIGLLPDDVREVWVEPGLAAALKSLSEKQRVVIALCHGFDWSMGEVAEFLGVSKSTVQSYENRGMQRLRRSLGVES